MSEFDKEIETGTKPETARSEVVAQDAPPRKAGFGAKVKRHCRRWWWLDILITIIIILVVVLPIIFVGIKHIAQKETDKSTLELLSQEVSNPTENSVHLALVTHVHSDTKYHANLEGFRAGLSIVTDDAPNNPPFGYIDIPPQKVEKDSTIIINQTIDIVDMDQFKAYNVLVLTSENMKVRMQGKTKLKLGSLPKYSIDFNKVVDLKGLNGFNGFNISSLQLHAPPLADGTGLTGKAMIPNPTIISIDAGNVTLDMYLGKDYVGTATLPNLIIAPGNHEYDMRATTDLSVLLKGITGSKVKIDIVGNSTTANGQHLPYYEAAFKANKLSTEIDINTLTTGGSNTTSS